MNSRQIISVLLVLFCRQHLCPHRNCSFITQNSQVLLLRGPLSAFGKCVISIFHILDLLVFAPNAIIAVFKESVRYTADVQRHKLKCKDKRTFALTSILAVLLVSLQ